MKNEVEKDFLYYVKQGDVSEARSHLASRYIFTRIYPFDSWDFSIFNSSFSSFRFCSSQTKSSYFNYNIDLDYSSVGKLNKKEWGVFREATKNTEMPFLSLCWDDLFKLDAEGWQVLGDELKDSEVTNLNIDFNYTLRDLGEGLKTLLNTLKMIVNNSQMTSLYFSKNILFQIAQNEWESIGEIIKDSKVTALYLRWNDLDKLNKEDWSSLIKGLNNTPLLKLDLQDNDLKTDINSLSMLSTYLKDTSIPIDFGHIFKDKKMLIDLSKNKNFKYPIPLGVLDLSNCGLEDDDIAKIVIPFLNSPCIDINSKNSKLHTLNLDKNHISYYGLKYLLKKLFSYIMPTNLENISVRHNYVAFKTKEELNELHNLLPISGSFNTVSLEGNLILSAKRNQALTKILTALVIKSGLSVDEFLQTEFVSLEDAKKNNFFDLKIKKSDGNSLVLSLNHREMDAYNEISKEHKELKHSAGIFQFIVTNGILPRRNKIKMINSNLLDCNFSKLSEHELKQYSRELIDYHEESPLKSMIRTHFIFKSPTIHYVPSILFPQNLLTRKEGRVYLLSINKGEHGLMAYEYLTGYGQRIFKVAQLKVVVIKNTNKPKIEFIERALEDHIPDLLKNYTIAPLSAKTEGLKKMHQEIERQRKLDDISNEIIYKKFLVELNSKTVQNNQEGKVVENCLKWATNKMKKYLDIELQISIYKPNWVVNTLLNNPDSILVKSEHIIENKV